MAKNPDSVQSVAKFYDATTLSYFLMCKLQNKLPDFAMVESRNNLLKIWRNADDNKNLIWIKLQKQVNQDEVLINKFIEYIDKNVEYDPDDNMIDIDRRHVDGCFGTVIE